MRGGLLGKSAINKRLNASRDMGKGGQGSHLPSSPRTGRAGPPGESSGGWRSEKLLEHPPECGWGLALR